MNVAGGPINHAGQDHQCNGKNTQHRDLPSPLAAAVSLALGCSPLEIYGIFTERYPVRTIITFLKDERAATAIEYGLIATGIAVAIIPIITGLGTKLKTT